MKRDRSLQGQSDSTARRLVVVVGGNCPSCQEAINLSRQAAVEFPSFSVQVIDLDEAGTVKPDAVFAVPTYLLNGRIISLGNPSMDDLRRHLLLIW